MYYSANMKADFTEGKIRCWVYSGKQTVSALRKLRIPDNVVMIEMDNTFIQNILSLFFSIWPAGSLLVLKVLS